jgi:hypothetical protein
LTKSGKGIRFFSDDKLYQYRSINGQRDVHEIIRFFISSFRLFGRSGLFGLFGLFRLSGLSGLSRLFR